MLLAPLQSTVNMQSNKLFDVKAMFIELALSPLHVTVNFLNIRTPKKFVVITLKFELCGSTIE